MLGRFTLGLGRSPAKKRPRLRRCVDLLKAAWVDHQPSFNFEPTRCYGNMQVMLINFSPESGEDSHASSRPLCQGLSGFNRAWLTWINMRSVYTALGADVIPKCLPCTPSSVLRRSRCGRSGCGQASSHAEKPIKTNKPADFTGVACHTSRA